jgi:hypothetical protein
MRSHPIPHSGEGRIALLRITSLWVTVEACSDGTRAMNANCFCCDASPEVTTSAARTAWASGPPRVRCRPAVSWMPAGRMGCGGPMRPMPAGSTWSAAARRGQLPAVAAAGKPRLHPMTRT